LPVPRYDLPKAAPGPLRLVQELVNTTDLEHEREFLPDSKALRAWLRSHTLVGSRTPVSPADLARTLELREALRGLLVANNDGRPSTGFDVLNRVADRARLGLRFGERGIAFVPRAKGVDRALGEILGVVAASLQDDSWERLKACRNCRWAFFDYSRNSSATWCSMQLCGNRLKTRAYRRRATRPRPRTAG
jgi:predicted RNA-binding Zn ribbon-like protein